jgi:hypothetical protein
VDDKFAGAILDDANASVRSEAEDERPSPAASNPTTVIPIAD